MTARSPSSVERSRYPGALPFGDSAEDRSRFFGRSEESEQLALRVLSVPLLVQFGRSGLGKTSLLQAGLFPRLRQSPHLPVMIRLNVADEPLVHAVERSIREAGKAEGLAITIEREAPANLSELLLGTIAWRDDYLLTPVLVFDQFEEIFTLRDAAFRAQLAGELGALVRANTVARPTARLVAKIVLSLREDYLGALEELSRAIPGLFQERLRLEPLSDGAARQAIVEPARLEARPDGEPYSAPRFELEPAALDDMITYLEGRSGVIEPFQLQLLCRHAESIACGKAGEKAAGVTLTRSDFAGAQGFESVLSNFYQDTLAKLPTGQRKRTARLCEEGLLNDSGHRLMLEGGQIRSEFHVHADTLDALERERIVRRERRLDSVFYEISHDRLADSIFKSRRHRLPKKTRRALNVAAVVVPAFLVALVVWGLDLKKERNKAREARDDAEKLNSFLLGEDFLGTIRDIGRKGMLGKVSTATNKYLADDYRGPALNQGLALRNQGDVERTRGRVAKAGMLFGRALEAIEKSEESPDRAREVARTHDRLGEALLEQNQITRALAHYDAAVAAWKTVASSDPKGDDCASLATAIVSAGTLHVRLGDAKAALEHARQGLEISSGALLGPRTSKDVCATTSSTVDVDLDDKSLDAFGSALWLRMLVVSFEDDYRAVAALAKEVRRLRPLSGSARMEQADALANVATNEPRERALKDCRQVLADFDELLVWDPENQPWRREHAGVQLLIAERLVDCHGTEGSSEPGCMDPRSIDEAEGMALRAEETFGDLLAIDPSHASLRTDLGWALRTRAKVLAQRGNHGERLKALERAERFTTQAKADGADTDADVRLGDIYSDKAEALEALHRLPEAGQALQEWVAVASKLVSAHPDNPTYPDQLIRAVKAVAELRRRTGDKDGERAALADAERLTKKQPKLSLEDELVAQRAEELRQFKEGRTAVDGQDYRAALRSFTAAASAQRVVTELDPGSPDAFFLLSAMYSRMDEAREKLSQDRVSALRAELTAARIAVLMAPEGHAEDAESWLRAATTDVGKFLYLVDTHHPETALALVQQEVANADSLFRSKPHYAPYLFRLGDAECALGMQRGKSSQAWEQTMSRGLRHLEEAAKEDRANPAYPGQLGTWHKYLADQLAEPTADQASKARAEDYYQQALADYQRAVKLPVRPGHAEDAGTIADAKKAIDELTARKPR